MASIIESFNDTLSEPISLAKLALYALPVYAGIHFYLAKNMEMFSFFVILCSILFLTLISIGINNINSNKRELLSWNIVVILYTMFRMLLAIGPITLLCLWVGPKIINLINLPWDFAHKDIIIKASIWTILGSFVMTSYLSFSRRLSVSAAYNLKIMYESTFDVFIYILFLIPKLAISNGILVGLVWYVLEYFKIPQTNPIFLYYCAIIVVVNVGMLSSYLAQSSYDLIKGKDSEYQDKFYMSGCKSDEYDKFKE